MSGAAKLIEVKSLRYAYPAPHSQGAVGQAQALRGVDFTLGAGETVILLGASGSGKTTFLLHLNGLLRGAGEIEICGERLDDATLAAIRQKVGLVFQNADDQLFLPTVMEDVCFGLLNHGVAAAEARARAGRILAKLHLTELAQRAPYHLSEGEKRRAALAGVLVMEPEILLLDEPTTSLDPPTRRELAAILNALPQGKVIVTHDTAFARALARQGNARAVFFEQGLIVDDGPVEDVLARRGWD